MSEQGVVQELGQTKTGKPKAKIAGKWFFFDRDVNNYPSVGQSIAFKMAAFNIDGKTFDKITAWRPAQNQQAAIVATPPPSGIDEASLRFISNVVGSAVAAGSCKEPSQVAAWFNAAKNALNSKKDEPQADDPRNYGPDADDPFGDSVPF